MGATLEACVPTKILTGGFTVDTSPAALEQTLHDGSTHVHREARILQQLVQS